MIIIGLTGSIGMGKSTIASQLARMGAKVCNADDIVHKLLAKKGAAVPLVEKQFPGVVKNGAVDRKALGDIVFSDKAQLRKLEHIMHPLVVAAENRFIAKQARLGTRIVALDIPLLFETGAEERCDIVIVASAPHAVQRQRVLRRANMTEQKFAHILRSQMPDREKRERGDFIVLTGLGKAYSYRMLADIVSQLGEMHEA